MENENLSPIGHTWDEIENGLFTPEELADSNKRVDKMIKHRKKKNKTDYIGKPLMYR
jgi:hypothetical protein